MDFPGMTRTSKKEYPEVSIMDTIDYFNHSLFVIPEESMVGNMDFINHGLFVIPEESIFLWNEQKTMNNKPNNKHAKTYEDLED